MTNRHVADEEARASGGELKEGEEHFMVELDDMLGGTDRRQALIAEMHGVIRASIVPMPVADTDARGHTVLAYDFMLDPEGRLFLLEVNSRPGNLVMGRYSFTADFVEEIAQVMVDEPYLGRPRSAFRLQCITDDDPAAPLVVDPLPGSGSESDDGA